MELRGADREEAIKCEPDDDTCSNSSDPERLEIEDREEQDNNTNDCYDEANNGYDMSAAQLAKRLRHERNSRQNSPNRSPVNRMDTPESNCSDTHIDQETTKLWQALAK